VVEEPVEEDDYDSEDEFDNEEDSFDYDEEEGADI